MRFPWNKESGSVAVAEPVTAVVEQVVEVPVVAKEPAPMPSRGASRRPKLVGDEMAEYIRVSEEIGIDCCTDLVREKLLRCLDEESIHVYNHKQVIEYLDEKLGNDWEWRGLRTIDAEHLAGFHTIQDGARNVNFTKEPYRGAVPLPVLLTVKKIQAAVPEVFFYVSAPKNNDGDPFLAVTSRQLGMYVVERWDEPNFRERGGE
jgi:hypothetical protein